jgi:hypothetical protein
LLSQWLCQADWRPPPAPPDRDSPDKRLNSVILSRALEASGGLANEFLASLLDLWWPFQASDV